MKAGHVVEVRDFPLASVLHVAVGRWHHAIIHYATAFALPVALLLAALGLAGQQANQFLFVPVLGVAAVALLGGVLPGVAAACVSVGAGLLLLFEPVGSSSPRDPLDVTRVAGLGIISIVVAAAVGSLRN